MFGSGASNGFGCGDQPASGAQSVPAAGNLATSAGTGNAPAAALSELYASIYQQWGRGGVDGQHAHQGTAAATGGAQAGAAVENSRSPGLDGAAALAALQSRLGNVQVLPGMASDKSGDTITGNGSVQRTSSSDAALLRELRDAGLKLDASNPKGNEDYYKQLEVKVQRRLLQNREAARRCREKRQAYVKQLEDQLEVLKKQRKAQTEEQTALNAKLAAGVDGVVGHGGTPSALSSLQEAEGRIGFYKQWQHEYTLAAAHLRAALMTSDVTEQQLGVLYEACRAAVSRYMLQKRQALEAGHALAVMVGGFFAPRERVLAWLGGFRPTGLLTMTTEVARTAKCPLPEVAELAQLSADVAAQEASLQSQFSLARLALLDSAVSGSGDDSSCTAFGMARQPMDGGTGGGGSGVLALRQLGSVMLQVDELLASMLERAAPQLTAKQRACAVISMYESFRHVQRLSDALANPDQDPVPMLAMPPLPNL